MKKLLLMLSIMITMVTQAQINPTIGVGVSTYGVLAEFGGKINNIRINNTFVFSGNGNHQHFLSSIGYSIPISFYDDGDFIHRIYITPSVGYSIGTVKKEGWEGKVYDERNNTILYQLETSYKFDNLETYISIRRTDRNIVTIGFRGHIN